MDLSRTEQRLLQILRSNEGYLTDREIQTEYNRRFWDWFAIRDTTIFVGMDTLQRRGLASGYVDYDGRRPVRHYRAIFEAV